MKISRPIVFLYIQSTGGNPITDRIVQISCIKIDTDGGKEEKNMLINPRIPIPAAASAIHGITDLIVQDKPHFLNICQSLFRYLKDCDIAGYNCAELHIPMLIEEFHRYGIKFPTWDMSVIDVLKYDQVLTPNNFKSIYRRYTGSDLKTEPCSENYVRATVEILFGQITGNENISPMEIDAVCQGKRKRFDFSGKAYIGDDGIVRWSKGTRANQPVLQDEKYLEYVLNNPTYPLELKNKLWELKNHAP